MTDDKVLQQALSVIGIQTDKYTREIFIEMYKLSKEKKGSLTIQDIISANVKMCKKHHLDYDTKRPYKFKNKKILIARFTKNGHEFLSSHNEYTTDIEKAHDYKNSEFAEEMIIEHKLHGVIIFPYYP